MHLMQAGNCDIGSPKCSRNRRRRRGIIPVRSTNGNRVCTEIRAREPEVAGRQRAIRQADVVEVSCNRTVEPNRVTRHMLEVVGEKSKARMELLKDDRLGLNLADLFGDDALGHLLDDEETLLDDLDGLGVADHLGRSVNDLGEVDGAVKVVGAVEVVEVGEG